MLINFYCAIIKQSIDCNALIGKEQWINITHLPEDYEIHEIYIYIYTYFSLLFVAAYGPK